MLARFARRLGSALPRFAVARYTHASPASKGLMGNRFLSALLVCLAVIFAAGCGGGGGTTDPHGPPPPPPTVTVSIAPEYAAMTFTQTQQFTATVLNASDATVTWKVDGIAGGNGTVGTIDATGLYTPPASVGSHTVTATSVADTSKTAAAPLDITDYAGVFTYHNDNLRTGQNLGETVLTPANVTASQFGKLFRYTVDGYIYAQPLYVANLAIPGQGTRNVVYVCTEHDSVYAFDADNRAPGTLWQVSFIGGGVSTVPSGDTGTNDITPEVGITGTPVIDPATKTLYVVAKTKEPGPTYVLRLHALDITTGAEKFGGPVVINATVAGTGDGNDGGGHIPFNSLRQSNRAALLLDHGLVYFASASHGDNDPYHGWVFAYNATTLAQVAVWNATPNESRGGIWQVGNGPAADAAGNVYVETGNGTFNASLGGTGYGDSFVRLTGSTLTVADYFTPYNQSDLEARDTDLGSSGPMLLPDQASGPAHLVVGSHKNGTLYLIDRDNMGHFNAAGDTQIVKELDGATGGSFGTPAYYKGAIYMHGASDVLRAFTWNGTTLTLSAQGSPTSSFPGTTATISANGNSDGIVWELQVDGFRSSGSAVLRAYDASNLSQLYSSSASGADAAGRAVKFTVPTVANGKVYVGTQSELDVYGRIR